MFAEKKTADHAFVITYLFEFANHLHLCAIVLFLYLTISLTLANGTVESRHPNALPTEMY